MYSTYLSIEDRMERELFNEDDAALFCAARDQAYEAMEEES